MAYDITSILDFKPPRFLCLRCRALLDRLSRPPEATTWTCSACGAEYVVDDWTAMREPMKYIHAHRWVRSKGHELIFDDVMGHSQALAKLIVESRGTSWHGPWPTMRLLYAVLSQAQAFVHFGSYGISHQMLGALKLASMRVDVRGWASNVDPNTRAEMEEWPNETPRFRAKAINSSSWLDAVPHQKLVIVDGLVAFTGSANLTNNGIRQADRHFDISSVVTDLDEVRRLNNEYFANVWAGIGEHPERKIVMFEDEPF